MMDSGVSRGTTTSVLFSFRTTSAHRERTEDDTPWAIRPSIPIEQGAMIMASGGLDPEVKGMVKSPSACRWNAPGGTDILSASQRFLPGSPMPGSRLLRVVPAGGVFA